MTLDQIAILHGTDKSSRHHGYCEIYEKYFEPLQHNRITLFEIGWGGYHFIDRGGNGARMWRDYFGHAESKIISTDIHLKTLNSSDQRIKFYQGSQDDTVAWDNIIQSEGNPDIVVDDGSHHSDLTIRSFQILWSFVKPGGYYVIEDLEASYWGVASDGQDFKGGRDNPNSSMNYFLNLCHSLNHGHSGDPDIMIDFIVFHRKMIVIKKK